MKIRLYLNEDTNTLHELIFYNGEVYVRDENMNILESEDTEFKGSLKNYTLIGDIYGDLTLTSKCGSLFKLEDGKELFKDSGFVQLGQEGASFKITNHSTWYTTSIIIGIEEHAPKEYLITTLNSFYLFKER